MIKSSYYKNSIQGFKSDTNESILGHLASQHEFSLDEKQKNSWQAQIDLLKNWLSDIEGTIAFEYSIPRMGKRIDCILIVQHIVFVIEFKIGSDSYDSASINQTVDYALDLKNFHSESHKVLLSPILICTKAEKEINQKLVISNDKLTNIFCINGPLLGVYIKDMLKNTNGKDIDASDWLN